MKKFLGKEKGAEPQGAQVTSDASRKVQFKRNRKVRPA